MAELGTPDLREGMLFGMGNPLLDICANGCEDMLEKYCLKPNSAILCEDKHKPLYGELVKNYAVEYIAGGATQNSMRVCQWILQKPKVAIFVGTVGNDEFGEILEKKAVDDGVQVIYQFHDSEPTGTCAVLLTSNGTNRSLCANLGAANHFTIDHLKKPENYSLMTNADFYYISGFFLTVNPPAMLEICEHACTTNKPFCLNLSAPFLSQFFKEPMMQVMPYVDILFGNESEAATFAKEQSLGVESVRDIAVKVSQLPKKNAKRDRMVIFTQGEDTVIVAVGEKVTEYPVEKLPAEKILDTNGAGDAFVGGFFAQYIQNKPIATCIKCGIYAATVIIQHSGCTFPPKPDFHE